MVWRCRCWGSASTRWTGRFANGACLMPWRPVTGRSAAAYMNERAVGRAVRRSGIPRGAPEDMVRIAALDMKQSCFLSHRDPQTVEWLGTMKYDLDK